MRKIWEIIDSKGTIYSGSEDEMRHRFSVMCSEDNTDEWDGDLKLVEIHAIIK